MTTLSDPAIRSFVLASAGHCKRGEIIRDEWNLGIYVGMRNGRPQILWGVVSPQADRFADACNRFDGVPRIRPSRSQGGTYTPRSKKKPAA